MRDARPVGKHYFYSKDDPRFYGVNEDFCCHCHTIIPDSDKQGECTYAGYYWGDMFVFTPYIPLMVSRLVNPETFEPIEVKTRYDE